MKKRLDDRDNRRNRVAITEKGKAAVKQCFQVCHEIDRRMMEGLSLQEKEDLDRLHRKLLDNLGEWKKCEKGGRCPC